MTLNSDKIIETEDVLRQLGMPKAEIMPAEINGFNKQDERQLLFGALYELKKILWISSTSLVH